MIHIAGIFALSLMLGMLITPVAACSGGGGVYPLDMSFEHDPVILVGQFVELDEAGGNGIFRVDQVLTGETVPRHILITHKSASTLRFIDAGGSVCGFWYSNFDLDSTM